MKHFEDFKIAKMTLKKGIEMDYQAAWLPSNHFRESEKVFAIDDKGKIQDAIQARLVAGGGHA